jgi:hypothetical protein
LDDVRDFTQIVHNKVRRTKVSNKIGYTPVDLNTTIMSSKKEDREINVDAVIEQARREGRLPPTPPSLAEHCTPEQFRTASEPEKPLATPQELSHLIMELQRENM